MKSYTLRPDTVTHTEFQCYSFRYDLHALVPRLGLFQDDPSQVPYDYDEVLRAVAPRPTLVYAPTGDRDATFADVDACVKAAMHANLTHLAPTDDNSDGGRPDEGSRGVGEEGGGEALNIRP